jgi:hypothetical protein
VCSIRALCFSRFCAVILRNPSFCHCIIISTFSSHRFYCFFSKSERHVSSLHRNLMSLVGQFAYINKYIIYIYIYLYYVIHTYMYIVFTQKHSQIQFTSRQLTAILIIFEGQFQVFQRFSSSKLVLKTVKNCFVALKCYENGSIKYPCMQTLKFTHTCRCTHTNSVHKIYIIYVRTSIFPYRRTHSSHYNMLYVHTYTHVFVCASAHT